MFKHYNCIPHENEDFLTTRIITTALKIILLVNDRQEI